MAKPPSSVQNLIELLRAGIAKIETGGEKNPYSATAGDKNKDGKPDSTAVGKYQFLKTYWWDTKYPIKGVKQFAKDKKDIYGDIQSWEDFNGNQALQEAYFAYYAKEHLIPEAKKAIANGNPLNLSLDQAAAVIHKEGFGNGKKVINSGKLSKETATNVSDTIYLKRFSEGIKEKGFNHISADDYVKAKESETGDLDSDEKKILKSREERRKLYEKRDKAISAMAEDGVDQGTIEKERQKLFQDVAKSGDQKLFDEIISEERLKAQSHKDLLDLMANGETKLLDNKGEDNDRLKSIKTQWADPKKVEAIVNNFPQYKEYFHVEKNEGKARIVIARKSAGGFQGTEKKSLEKFIDSFNTENKEIFGDAYEPISNKRLSENWDENIGKTLLSSVSNIGRKLDGKTPIMPGALQVGSTDKLVDSVRPKIDWSKVEVPQEEKPTPEQIGETVQRDSEGNIVDDASRAKYAKQAEDAKKPTYTDSNGIVDQLASSARLNASQTQKQHTYDPSNTKRDLPINSLIGGALGIAGSNQAKDVKIPERDEKVSDAMIHFATELAKRSNEGLPPHVEAAMKSKLEEVYQGGVEQLRNLSGGNRALILGNQGQLETARAKGIVDMELADYEAKERAFQQYGQALRYMNDFEARKDIANHSIAYQEAMRKRDIASATSQAGFKMLMDDINYQKTNGPGSANDMLRSYYEQEIFGFDSKAKPGAPNSKEAFDAKKAKSEAFNQKQAALASVLERLPEEKKGIMADFYKNNSNLDDGLKFAQALSQQQDPSSYDPTKIEAATKAGNFGLVFGTPERVYHEAPKQQGPLSEETSLQGILAKTPESLNVKPESVIPGLPVTLNQEQPIQLPDFSGNSPEVASLQEDLDSKLNWYNQ